ncbi:uncharacterized protein K452DRAFT_172250 [Aplosporella prunicola CBS 121167]|uniref:Uncharacterized protein n=1 Tax=Aplosporella prunicola CBS 121167 TaxID=1176127 RepID=A0A6A6AWK4_9PEZI|nr:uncharacterized protein K452DRAFT_172250 [Aplosporella prunicola CBS 121167]KAF2135638.1 hypothetical protein K452DRAFT_172250 [Aplosporella prunicola CBS 121167]
MLQDSLERMINIALDKTLSQYVETLVFRPRELRAPGSFKEWKGKIERFVGNDPLLLAGSPHGTLQSPYSTSMSDQELRELYDLYKADREAPMQFLDCYLGRERESKSNPMVLLGSWFDLAIENLHQLKTFEAIPDPDDCVWRGIQFLSSYPWTALDSEAQAHLACILVALGRSSTKPRSMVFNTIGGAFWGEENLEFLWGEIPLSEQKLFISDTRSGQIETSPYCAQIWWMKQAFTNITDLEFSVECDENLFHGIVRPLADCLRAAGNLERLVFACKADSASTLERPEWDILSQLEEVQWPRLRHLHMELLTTEKSLTRLLSHIAPTLRYLSLAYVQILPYQGKWERIFNHMANVLSLDEVCLVQLKDYEASRREESDFRTLFNLKDLQYSLNEEESDEQKGSKADAYGHYEREVYDYILKKVDVIPTFDQESFYVKHLKDCAWCIMHPAKLVYENED